MDWKLSYMNRATKLAHQSPFNSHYTRDWNGLEDDVMARNITQCRELFALCEEKNNDGAMVLLTMLQEHPDFRLGYE
jgi:hypothetical protein